MRLVTLRVILVALEVISLLTLVVLIVGLLWNQVSSSNAAPSPADRPTVAKDQVVHRSEMSGYPQQRFSPLADPDRVRRMLEAGRTYEFQIKGGFVASGTDVDYCGSERTVRVAHAFETIGSRTIEANDGRRIVEVRRFERVWAVTLLSEKEDLALELGPPGKPLLQALRRFEPHVGTRRALPRPIAEAILEKGAEGVAESAATQAFWESDSLSGKTVRITYVDGVGVERIRPLGCDLSGSDRQFLFALPVLWDGYVLPGENAPPGDTWSVDAVQLTGLMPPPMCWILGGEFVVRRSRDHQQGGKQYADLPVCVADLNSFDRRKFLTAGAFQYNLGDQRITAATLNWPAGSDCLRRLRPREDHRFPHVALFAEPTIQLHYSCKIRPPASGTAVCSEGTSVRAPVRRVRQPAQPSRAPGADKWASAVPWGRLPVSRPPDLVVGILILLILSIVLFRWGVTMASDLSKRLSCCVTMTTVTLIVVFATAVHGQLFIAQILPFSNVIVVGNWIPMGASLLAGIVAGQRALPLWRRAAFVSILITLGWYTVFCHCLGATLVRKSRFQNGVSIQTSPVSCSPCCAVTLLGCCGIESTEGEMARLCLTGKKGTPPLGLYRGLKSKTRGTKWDVSIVRCSVERLRQADLCPVVVSVRLPSGVTRDRHQTGWEWTWQPGARHTVVVLGFTPDGQVAIGDPSNLGGGYTRWPVDDFKQRWHGEGLCLVKRDRPRWSHWVHSLFSPSEILRISPPDIAANELPGVANTLR